MEEKMKYDDVREAEVIKVIRVLFVRGDGKEDCIRGVTQYWSLDGKLLAEDDPIKTIEDGR